MASILVTMGKQEGDYWPLGQRTTVIGRGETLPVQILDDLISRQHLQIRFDKEQDRYLALDMKSSNGVFVNNSKINDETPLVDGDSISIGQTVLLFTDKDFHDRKSAMTHFKKVGERMRVTAYQPKDPKE